LTRLFLVPDALLLQRSVMRVIGLPAILFTLFYSPVPRIDDLCRTSWALVGRRGRQAHGSLFGLFFSSCFILPLRYLGPNMLIASVYSLVDLGHSVMGAKAAVWQTGSFQGLYFLLSSTLGAHD